MKMTVRFALLFVLSMVMIVTGIVWAIENNKVPLPAPLKQPYARPARQFPTITPSPKTVFITYEKFTGNIGGVSGGDAICLSLARQLGLQACTKLGYLLPVVSHIIHLHAAKDPISYSMGEWSQMTGIH